MKRSRKVGLLAASASVLLLTACYEEDVSAKQGVSVTSDGSTVYASLEACTNDLEKPGSGAAAEALAAYDAGRLKCLSDWEAAKTEHEKTAPRFSSLQECEADFGAGACGAAPQAAGSGASGSGGSFMPFLMGYMIGNALSPTPAYNNNGGWSRTPPAKSTLRSSGSYGSGVTRSGDGAVKASPSATATTPKKTTLSPSTRSRSGGFGSSLSSGRSSFGG